ncbi:hypothetical protein C471_13726 [Halorubrum saccharovorum DSM 1137]|uniref:Uncharacterized protein n=2 Tax=Halorubrum saccharovorum TaxID=2248 RepID=M0DQL9_9EURY|nr:hypothetical protein C471_13726 [Halorubrum saccharovorum DSM 1137]
MTDNDLEMERGRAQAMHSFGEANVVDMGDLGVTAEVRPWRNSYEIDDIDKERIVAEINNRAERHQNRTTGDTWDDLTSSDIDIYQVYRSIETRLFPTIFYCEDCKKIHSTAREYPQQLPSDGKCEVCDGKLTQLSFVNVCRCGRLEDPSPPKPCSNHAFEDYRIQKTSSGPASWRFRCNKCGNSMGGMSKSCGVCNEMDGPLPTASSRIYYSQRFVRANIPLVDIEPEEMPTYQQWARVLAAVYLGYQDPDDMTIEELATEEGKSSQFEEMVEDGEDPETVKRILEGMGIPLEGRGLALEDTEHIVPFDAQKEFHSEEADRKLAWSNTSHALFTFMRTTDGYDGDPEKIKQLDYPNPTDLEIYTSDPEFRSDHPQSSRYRDQLNKTNISQAWVVDQFPLLNVLYGYSRGDPEPRNTDLKRFTHPRGKNTVPVFADRAPSEAIVLEIDRAAIINWLVANDLLDESAPEDSRYSVPDTSDERALKEWFLTNIATTELENPFADIEDEITEAVYTLLHSMSHCLLARAGEQCGLATDTLGERVFSNIPAIVIYASTTESFSIGSMSTLFKTRLHPWLSQARDLAEDCLLDPACSEDTEGAACDACIHISETSCEFFNHSLDRRLLEGKDKITGFWEPAIQNSSERTSDMNSIDEETE